MRWTPEQYEAFLQRTKQPHPPERAGIGRGAELQKLEVPGLAKRKANDAHKAGIQSLDGPCDSLFRLSITLRIADERNRDPDGAASTIIDCLVAAAGRLTEMDRGDLCKLAASLKKRGRGKRHG